MSIDEESAEKKWREDRLGNVTGSRIYDVVGRNRDKSYKAARRRYSREKLIERLTGQVQDNHTWTTPAIEWGRQNEINALKEYRLFCPFDVVPMGKVYVPHHTIKRAGCSPDALVGDIGGLEIKCPETDTHLSFLDDGQIAIEYMPQVLWCLACTQRAWWDFMSFDPRCPEHMVKRITRIHQRDYKKEIAELEAEVQVFLDEVEFQVLKWKDWKR